MTAAEYRAKHGKEQSLPGMGAPSQDYDQALAIDPGTDTGLAWTDGEVVKTVSSDFWETYTFLCNHDPQTECILLEAPYKSRQSMGRKPAIAYNSGGVAREAELLRDAAEDLGYTVIEHDPSQQGQKWDRELAKQVVGGWEGPNNEHCRDAIRLLFFYNFL